MLNNWPSFKYEDTGGEVSSPTLMDTGLFGELGKSGSSEFDLFDFDQLQANFSNLFPFNFLTPIEATPTTASPSEFSEANLSPSDPHLPLQPPPVTMGGKAIPIFTEQYNQQYDDENDDNDMVRMHFSSGEFLPEVDFREPESVSISSSRRSVSPAPSTYSASSHSSMSTLNTTSTADDSLAAVHIRNSRHAHAPLRHLELPSYAEDYDEEPDTEEEEWRDPRDDSESRRKRKRRTSTRALFRSKKTASGETKRTTSQKTQSAPASRRQRPNPPKREKKRRDWVGHPRAHEISAHIYDFLVQCRQAKQKPSAADIFKSNPDIFIDFGITEADKNKIGEHLRDIYRGRSTDPAGLLTKDVVWDLWYDQTRVASARRCVV